MAGINTYNVLVIATVAALFFAADALAATTSGIPSSPLASISPLAKSSYEQSSSISYLLAGLGAIGAGAISFFGRFSAQWLVLLVLSLVLVSGAPSLIYYVTGFTL
ncbi:MAG: hypothetical protein ACK5XX_07875 [Holosporales bacterium]|jgi:hypothetical protein